MPYVNRTLFSLKNLWEYFRFVRCTHDDVGRCVRAFKLMSSGDSRVHWWLDQGSDSITYLNGVILAIRNALMCNIRSEECTYNGIGVPHTTASIRHRCSWRRSTVAIVDKLNREDACRTPATSPLPTKINLPSSIPSRTSHLRTIGDGINFIAHHDTGA